MKNIAKNPVPDQLAEQRLLPDADFRTMSQAVKQVVRESLLDEQGALCCYCMSRLALQHSVIEHWMPQSRFPDNTLDYDNMLLSCEGGRNRRRPGDTSKTLHCDTRKGSALLKYNPAKDDIEGGFAYAADGTVRYAADAEFDRQIDELLNLNEEFLRRQRAAVIDAVITALYMITGIDACARLRILRDKWLARDACGRLQPYCMAAVYYIDKRIQKLQGACECAE